MEPVAKVIYRQLMEADANLMLGIRASGFVLGENALRFKVAGGKHRGYVHVIYDSGLDLYNVELAIIRKLEWKVKTKVDGLGIEQLISFLEKEVY